MDTLIYEKIFASEGSHFYYKSNRGFISSLIKKYSKVGVSKQLKILDVGCGTGLTTKYLERFGKVIGIDINPLAVKYSKTRGVKVVFGSVDKLPFGDNAFDLVVCFDVIYHTGVADDRKALREIYRVLKPGGICILRVPAKIFAKSSYDRSVHTKHRYTKEELERKLMEAGCNILKLSFADVYLLPLILFSKTKIHIYKVPDLINFLLTLISSIEKKLMGYINLPFGAGIISVVVKPAQEPVAARLNSILTRYLDNKPAFLSIVRAKEAFLFNSFAPYPKPILDYGCGDGFFTETSFMGSGQKVDTGLEINLERARAARTRKFYDKVAVYSGRKIPFSGGIFSTVISNSVLEHVSDIDRSLKEMSRVLKKTGRLYLSLTTSQYEKNLFGTLIFGDWYVGWMRKRAYHANMLKRSEIEAKLRSSGFEIIDRIGYLNKANTRFLDVMQYLSIPGKIPLFSGLFRFINKRVFMKAILRRIKEEKNDGSFCCYFYILSKK